MTAPNQHTILQDYEVIKTLVRTDHYDIFLGKKLSDGQRVVLKQTVFQNGDLSGISKLGHEYDIMKDLDHPGIPKVYDFLFDGNTAILVEEYIDGNDLKSLIFKSKLSYDNVLDLTVELTGILHYLHEHSVIHKDLSPGNIMLTGDGSVKLVDFGISSNLFSESNELLNIDKIEGTLNYISPEQTSRTVYSVTHSCDFYSFGILLYELLAGKLPFDSIDPLEIIHFHLSRKPLPLSTILPDLPAGLEKVVFKLLEKNPDERYLSAAGIKADLELIKKHYHSGKPLTFFKAGAKDKTMKYNQAQKLYGREKEIEQIKKFYENLDSVKSMVALVSGYSGVGKSALIRQTKIPIIQNNGTFISGKFDQLKKDIPYYAFIEAIKEFIKNLLSDPSDKIDAWKHRIISVLGENAGLITDVIPQLSLIIGDQPSVPKLQPAEQESRFNMVLLDFIYAFSTSKSPLVIFLDDLQWADWSSLNLMKRILENSREESIMMIGAYRDNEVHQGHPLMITLQQISASEGVVKSIHLEPLNLETTIRITADSFGMKVEQAEKLGRLVFSKTKGNPFFIHSFLKSLFDKDLVKYDSGNHWTWDRKNIDQLEYTANVIDLMTKGLTDLPKPTQKVLQYAAVLGNTFSFTDLSDIAEKTEAEVYENLKQAIKGGYISSIDLNYRTLTLKSFHADTETIQNLPTEKVEFTFSHDKVQQAAYNLISEIERPYVHLKTGRQLLQSRDEAHLQDDIFEVMNHFVFSSDLIKDKAEKLKITKLCLLAGRKAKGSNSYSLGVRFLNMGKNLLGNNSWTDHYKLTYNVLMELGECEYLNDNPSRAEVYFKELLNNSKTRFEKLKVYYIHSSLYLKIGNTSESLRLGLKAAKLYDIRFPTNKKTIQAAASMQLAKYLFLFSTKYRNPESLFHLKDCKDEELIVLNKFLIDLSTSAYQQDQNLMMLVIFKIIGLYIQQGFTDASCWGFSGFSVVVLSALKMQKKGFNIWDITLKLHQRTNSPLIKWRLSYTVLCFHNHWRIPIRDGYDQILDTIKACVLNGDQIFTSYTVALYLRSRINAGENLAEILKSSNDHIALIKNSKGGFDFFECFYQMAKALNGQTYPDSWNDDSFNGSEAQKRLKIEGNKTKLGFFHSAKCNFLYLNGDYSKALKESEIVLSYADNFVGDMQEVSHAFYTSLSISACYESLSQSEKRKYLKVYKSHLKDMKMWAEGCPENYSQHYHLMRAELFSIQDKFEEALQSYENAIQRATENQFKHIEAIANERAGKFCSNAGLEKQSQLYIESAWYAYHKWGAHAKCKKLEKMYPEFLHDKTKHESAEKSDGLTTTSSTSELDLASVIKATQSIASQVKYDDLLNNLLQITIENAGAERGCLVLEKENQLCIEAIGISGSDIIEILPSVPIDTLKIMPDSILNYCWRTKETVVLDNAQTDDQFGSDPYFLQNNTLSVMCLPITALGKSIGLLYLDNSLIKGVFNKNRIELLQTLSGQIGISIENANLYSNLEMRVEQRTEELKKKNKKIEEQNDTLKETLEKLKATQNQLIHAEKMASLGELTAGIAHEIKNPLNFVTNFSDVSIDLLEELRNEMKKQNENVKSETKGSPFEGEKDPINRGQEDGHALILEILNDIEANIKKIHEHGSRADGIVKSMLQHSRKGSGKMDTNNLNAIIRESVNLAFHGMRAGAEPINVDIELDLDDSIGEIKLIAEDFSRVILNLCNNAFDAMREKLSAFHSQGSEKSPFKGGKNDKIIRGDNPVEAISEVSLQSSNYQPKLTVRTYQTEKNVTIEIEDNGPGIPEEIKDKILQPFFTTKKGTAGTGLGLSITNDIIKAHGGLLDIASKKDELTRFTIHLNKEQR